MRLEERRAAWNAQALKRLEAARAELPPVVLAHALRSRWMPRTLRAAVDSYWRAHPLRADRLARALAAASGAPAEWAWKRGDDPGGFDFRTPPLPYRPRERQSRAGRCVVCGTAVHRLGWHRELEGPGASSRRAGWHACCVVAWKLWTAPSDHRKLLSRVQGHRCALSGRRLLRTAEVDHRLPLHRVWRDRRDAPWPELLGFWGLPNLQVVNLDRHAEKTVGESRERALRRAERSEAAG